MAEPCDVSIVFNCDNGVEADFDARICAVVRMVAEQKAGLAELLRRTEEIAKLPPCSRVAINERAIVGVYSPWSFLQPIPGLGHPHLLIIEAEDGNHRTAPDAAAQDRVREMAHHVMDFNGPKVSTGCAFKNSPHIFERKFKRQMSRSLASTGL